MNPISVDSRWMLASLSALVLAAGHAPAAYAAPPEAAPQGVDFACQDGTKLVLDFLDQENGVAAAVLVHGEAFRLPLQPVEPGPARIVWSDGQRSLTWSAGVQLMWMDRDAHLMCGRGGHKH